MAYMYGECQPLQLNVKMIPNANPPVCGSGKQVVRELDVEDCRGDEGQHGKRPEWVDGDGDDDDDHKEHEEGERDDHVDEQEQLPDVSVLQMFPNQQNMFPQKCFPVKMCVPVTHRAAACPITVLLEKFSAL